MTTTALTETIIRFCEENGSEEQLIKSQRIFKHAFHGYGIKAPVLHAQVKEWSKNAEINIDVILETLESAMKRGMYEEIASALLMLFARKKHFTADTFAKLDALLDEGIDNWAHADILGMWILPVFLTKNIVPISAFEPWLQASNSYKRRCVPVTLIKLVKTSKKAEPFIYFPEILMQDKVREVHQGMGWFLREAWKLDPISVETFLQKWKHTAPRLIFQYACEKMTVTHKKKFKKN